MASLLIGFVGMVLIPALVLSVVLGKFNYSQPERGFQDEEMPFTFSSEQRL